MSVFTHPAELALKRAMADHAAGRLTDAEIGYRFVLHDHPNDPLTTHLLGLVAGKKGRLGESVDLLEAAVKLGDQGGPNARPPLAFYLAWVDAAVAAGQTDRAIDAAKATVAGFPKDPTAADRLAKLLAGTLTEPPVPDQTANDLHARAQSHEDRREWVDAISLRRQALAARHHDPVGHKRLANVLMMVGRHEEAAAEFQTALDQCPGDAECLAGIGAVRIRQERFDEARDLMREGTRLDPNRVDSWNNLALASLLGDHAAAVAAARRASELDPADPVKHSALIALTNYTDGDRPGVILAESQRWAERFAPPLWPDQFKEIDRNPKRQLRVGFLSPDFRTHSVCFFFASVMGRRDRSKLWVALYGEVQNPDDMTVRVRAVADAWRSTVGVSDANVADQIRADRIDILIDLCGHLEGNRLPVLGLKPAPVQMTWLGYPNTTGIPEVDYRITDANADPPGTADEHYTEKLIRLPNAFFAYTPVPDTPDVSPLPMPTNGHPTFGVFHLLQKVSEKACDHWAAAMKAVPAAKLLWLGVPESARPMMLQRMTSRGIAAGRIELIGRVPLAEFFALHARVDFALDTYPWVGHTSTCHSLWAGVPTLTLAGPTAVSRAGASVLGCLGLADDWVAGSVEEFAAKAAARAADPAALADLRGRLRPMLAESPLTDTTGFARDFESALREAWKRWCEAPPAGV
jgi:predicted O-linked N-acetylglucosamine transferase (SPINDLY family)